jgi:predicted nucleotidyltransferase
MIVSREADLKVLDVLCRNPFTYFSIYELAKISGLSHTWVYKVVKNLEEHDLVVSQNKRIKINLENTFAVKLKEMLDMQRIYETDLKKEILEVFQIIADNYGDDLKNLCLIGSVVGMKHRKGSDIDFLLVTKKSRKDEYEQFGLTRYENMNVIEFTPIEFDKKYLATDDFVISSLYSLLILFDDGFIIKYLQKPLPYPSSDIIRGKIKQLDTLRERIVINLKIRDYSNTKKALVELLVQLARIKLFKNRVVPRSKYELAKQIKPIDRNIAKDLGTLLGNKITNKKLIEMGERYGFKSYRSI